MEGIIALLIPIITTVAFFAMIVLIERQKADIKRKMIDAGMNPHNSKRSFSGSGALKWGYLLIGFGAALFLAYLLENLIDFKGDTEAIYFGLIGIFGGVGLIKAHHQARKEEQQDRLEQ